MRVIAVPPQPGAPAPQVFPPNPNGTPLSWPEKLAVSADGSRLLVALNMADSAAVIDLDQGDQVHYVAQGSGSFPFGAAILPDGRTGLVTNEGTGTMSVIDMQSATQARQHPGWQRRCLIPRVSWSTAPGRGRMSRCPTPIRSPW